MNKCNFDRHQCTLLFVTISVIISYLLISIYEMQHTGEIINYAHLIYDSIPLVLPYCICSWMRNVELQNMREKPIPNI